MEEKGMKNMVLVPFMVPCPWQRRPNSSSQDSIKNKVAFAAFAEFHIFGKLASVRVEGVAMECKMFEGGGAHVDERGGTYGGSKVGHVGVWAAWMAVLDGACFG
jgi:hypothetical protein